MKPNRRPDGKHTVTLQNWFEFGIARDQLSQDREVFSEFDADCKNIDQARESGKTEVVLSHVGSVAVVNGFIKAAEVDFTVAHVLNAFHAYPGNPFAQEDTAA